MRYAVTGFAQSGTSMMMRSLNLGGIPVLAKGIHLTPSNSEKHPYGKYEESRNYVQQWKDGMAYKLMGKERMVNIPDEWHIKAVYMMRNPYEVYPGHKHVVAMKLWINYDHNQRDYLITKPNFEILDVWYHDVINHPEREMQRIADFGIPINVEVAASVPEVSMWHTRDQDDGRK